MLATLLQTAEGEPPLPAASSFHEEDRLRYRDILHDILHDILRAGVGLVRTLELRSANATMEGANAVIEAAAAYERVTRSMRRTILLATKLTDPDPKPTTPHSRSKPTPAAAPSAPERPARESAERVRDEIERPDAIAAPAEIAETEFNPEDQPESLEDEPEHVESEAPQGPLDPDTHPIRIAALRLDLDLSQRPRKPRTPDD